MPAKRQRPPQIIGNAPPFDRDGRPGEDFSLVVKDGDPGDRKNPERCVFARCAKRALRTDNAWFGNTVAYVGLPTGPNGAEEIVRFLYAPKTEKALKAFDEPGGTLPPGIYKVVPPRPSQTIAGRHRRNARNPKRVIGKPGSQAGKRRPSAWHAPRGWGQGITRNGDAIRDIDADADAVANRRTVPKLGTPPHERKVG